MNYIMAITFFLLGSALYFLGFWFGRRTAVNSMTWLLDKLFEEEEE